MGLGIGGVRIKQSVAPEEEGVVAVEGEGGHEVARLIKGGLARNRRQHGFRVGQLALGGQRAQGAKLGLLLHHRQLLGSHPVGHVLELRLQQSETVAAFGELRGGYFAEVIECGRIAIQRFQEHSKQFQRNLKRRGCLQWAPLRPWRCRPTPTTRSSCRKASLSPAQGSRSAGTSRARSCLILPCSRFKTALASPSSQQHTSHFASSSSWIDIYHQHQLIIFEDYYHDIRARTAINSPPLRSPGRREEGKGGGKRGGEGELRAGKRGEKIVNQKQQQRFCGWSSASLPSRPLFLERSGLMMALLVGWWRDRLRSRRSCESSSVCSQRKRRMSPLVGLVWRSSCETVDSSPTARPLFSSAMQTRVSAILPSSSRYQKMLRTFVFPYTSITISFTVLTLLSARPIIITPTLYIAFKIIYQHNAPAPRLPTHRLQLHQYSHFCDATLAQRSAPTSFPVLLRARGQGVAGELRRARMYDGIGGESLEVDFEDLPLLDEELPLGVSGEGEAGLGRADVLAVVVADGELSVGALLVAVVDDADVAAAEDRALVRVVGDRELRQVQVELLPHVQREDEGLQRLVRRPLLLRRAPRDRREPPDHLPELRLHHHQRPRVPVALLVELADREGVLGGPEEQLQRADLGLEEPAHRREVGDHAAVERAELALDLLREGGGRRAVAARARLEVEVGGAVEQLAHLLLQRGHLALDDLRRLHLALRSHLRQDGRQVVARDLREAALGEVLDELHHLDPEAVGLDPEAELGVLSAQPAQQLQEHVVHLLAEVGELLRAQVGVIVDQRLHLRPEHLLAPLVEQPALVARVEARLADEARLAAVGVRAHRVHRTTVDALGALQLPLARHNKIHQLAPLDYSPLRLNPAGAIGCPLPAATLAQQILQACS